MQNSFLQFLATLTPIILGVKAVVLLLVLTIEYGTILVFALTESESVTYLSHWTVCSPMDCSPHQAPLSMEFSRQEYWSG